MNLDPMRMPFGKHRGEPVEDLPTDYLEWCLENLDWGNRQARGVLREEMESQLKARRGEGIMRRRGNP